MIGKKLIAIGAFSMAMAIVLGAIAAHSLENSLSPEAIDSFRTGVRYQAWNSLGLIILQLIPGQYINPIPRQFISRLLIIGIVAFSFSIYLLNTSNLLGMGEMNSFLGPITPIGGLILIAAWVWLAIAVLRNPAPQKS